MSLPGDGALGSSTRRAGSMRPASLAAKRLSEQRRHRGAHERRIGDVGVAHRVGEPRRLERDVEALGAERIERGEIEAFEDIEQHQRGQALSIGRQFEDIEAAIIGRNRLHHVAAMRGEVLGGEE